MPCDQILVNQVEFNGGTDRDIFVKSLETLGYSVYRETEQMVTFGRSGLGGRFQDGVFTVRQGTDVDEIKREYAKESVKRTAARMGWRVEIDKKDTNKMKLVKRT